MDRKNNKRASSVFCTEQSEKHNVDIYCGFYRNTVVRCNAKVVQNIALAVPCIECGGTGVWDYFPEDGHTESCICCKGTGVQYIGI